MEYMENYKSQTDAFDTSRTFGMFVMVMISLLVVR